MQRKDGLDWHETKIIESSAEWSSIDKNPVEGTQDRSTNQWLCFCVDACIISTLQIFGRCTGTHCIYVCVLVFMRDDKNDKGQKTVCEIGGEGVRQLGQLLLGL